MPNGISIGSAVFAGLTVVTDRYRPTDQATLLVLRCGLLMNSGVARNYFRVSKIQGVWRTEVPPKGSRGEAPISGRLYYKICPIIFDVLTTDNAITHIV